MCVTLSCSLWKLCIRVHQVWLKMVWKIWESTIIIACLLRRKVVLKALTLTQKIDDTKTPLLQALDYKNDFLLLVEKIWWNGWWSQLMEDHNYTTTSQHMHSLVYYWGCFYKTVTFLLILQLLPLPLLVLTLLACVCNLTTSPQ